MKMTDLLSKEEWAEFEREFKTKTGLNSNVYDPDGFTFTGAKKQGANKVCSTIRSKPEALQSVCSVAHQNLAQIARNTKAPVVGECDIGLLKICVPVFVNDEFLGVVGGCGHLLEGSEVDTFLIHKLTGLEESEVAELANDVKEIPQAEGDSVAAEMQEWVQATVDSSHKS